MWWWFPASGIFLSFAFNAEKRQPTAPSKVQITPLVVDHHHFVVADHCNWASRCSTAATPGIFHAPLKDPRKSWRELTNYATSAVSSKHSAHNSIAMKPQINDLWRRYFIDHGTVILKERNIAKEVIIAGHVLSFCCKVTNRTNWMKNVQSR